MVESHNIELRFLRELYSQYRKSEHGFSLAIIVTSDCNFRCVYCHQKHVHLSMTRQVQLRVLQYIKNTIKYGDHLNISWWGGEPLLASRIIKAIGHETRKHCESIGATYTSRITTNGSLLNLDNIHMLVHNNLRSIQITLDGNRYNHNKSRPMKGGHPTYDTIISNLKLLVNVAPHVHITIRSNIKQDTACTQSLIDLLDDLAPLAKHIRLHIGPAIESKECKFNELSTDEYTHLLSSLMPTIKASGFRMAMGDIIPGRPICGTLPSKNFFIHPNGLLYKCTNIPHGCLGNVGFLDANGGLETNANYLTYDAFDPFSINECCECYVFPICMGGCPKVYTDKFQYDRRCLIKQVFPEVLPYLVANN